MHIQADSSTTALPAPAVVLGGAATTASDASATTPRSEPQAAPPSETEGTPTAASTPPLLNWNTCRPDGTLAALQLALDGLAQAFRGEVYVALEGERSATEFHTSPAAESLPQMPLIRSATTEAAHTGTACLFAAEGGQSSLVLQQLREAKQATLALGFAVN